jgi:hypothetical protein
MIYGVASDRIYLQAAPIQQIMLVSLANQPDNLIITWKPLYLIN